MNLHFSEEQVLLQNMVQQLVRDKYDFASYRDIIGTKDGMSRDNWRQFAELGLLAAPFDMAYGGLGDDIINILIIMEAFGQGLVNEPYLPTIILCGGLLHRHGSPAQKEHLAAMADGSEIWTLAYSEEQSRYDPAIVQTTATVLADGDSDNGDNGSNHDDDGDGFILNGRKILVPGLPWADRLIVSARLTHNNTGNDKDADDNKNTESKSDKNNIGLFIVEKAGVGITTQNYQTIDGGRAGDITFDNVRLGKEVLIGAADNGFTLLEEALDYGTLALCAEAMGVMKMANEATWDYARTREQFGQPIGKFQVLRHRMVDMLSEYEQAVSLILMAAWQIKAGRDADTRACAVSAAKARIGRAGRFIGQNGVHIHGGMGLADDCAIGHYFKRLTAINMRFGNIDYHLKRFASIADKEPGVTLSA